MKIGVIIAMDIEYRQMHDAIGGDTGRLGNNEIVLWQCGIGKVNAAVGTMRLIQEHHPDAILSTGLAGGIDPQMQVGDILAATQCVYHDVDCGGISYGEYHLGQVQGLPARYQADPHLLNKAISLQTSDIALHPGLIVTGDWFVDSKEKMREIVGHFPEAKAVDMESCAIAQTCYINKVPFISFRVISDIPLRDTDASQYHNFWDTVADHSFQVTKTFVESL